MIETKIFVKLMVLELRNTCPWQCTAEMLFLPSFLPAKHKEAFKLSALEDGLIISVWLLACTKVKQINMP